MHLISSHVGLEWDLGSQYLDSCLGKSFGTKDLFRVRPCEKCRYGNANSEAFLEETWQATSKSCEVAAGEILWQVLAVTLFSLVAFKLLGLLGSKVSSKFV